MATRILIIDGDISLSTVLNDYLVSRGYKAHVVHTGREGQECLKESSWDIVLTELQGYREDQMRAFQLGCDDYQTKPFTMDILICRIEAILRRVRALEENKQKLFELNGKVFDAVHQTFDGKHMSSRESDLLLMLCRHEGDVVDKHRILVALWKEDNAFTARSLGVYINHLRQFLRPANYEIIAVRYKGYKLVTDVTV